MSKLIVEMEMPKYCCADCDLSNDGFACKKARMDGGKCPIVGVLHEGGFSGGVSDEITKAWERYLESERAKERIAVEEDINRRRCELEELKRIVKHAEAVIAAERKDDGTLD